MPDPEAVISYEEFSQQRNSGAAPEAAAVVEETPVTEQEAPAQDEPPKPKESEVPEAVQKRINKAVAKQREAERERDAIRQQLERFQAPKPAEESQKLTPRRS